MSKLSEIRERFDAMEFSKVNTFWKGSILTDLEYLLTLAERQARAIFSMRESLEQLDAKHCILEAEKILEGEG